MNAFTLRALPGMLLLALLLVWAAPAFAADSPTGAAALRERHAALGERLARSPFKQPLLVESSDTSNNVLGEVYARLAHPFTQASAVFNGPARWCDVLMLHLNTKYCRSTAGPRGEPMLVLNVGRKYDQPAEQAPRLEFTLRMIAMTPDFMEAQLTAESGPLGTSNYLIVLQLLALDANTTFMHLSYGFSYGFASRLAMDAYLNTVARDKVGFTTLNNGNFIGGVRGVMERNVMRYYLAVEAYLDALSAPAGEQQERRLQNWFTASERYARQLHELERQPYLEMKRRELQRAQAG